MEIKQWPHDMPQLEFGSPWSPGPPSERAVELAKEMGDGWRPALALIRGYDPCISNCQRLNLLPATCQSRDSGVSDQIKMETIQTLVRSPKPMAAVAIETPLDSPALRQASKRKQRKER